MKLRTGLLILLLSAGSIRADQNIASVQQALKDQGFYYGEITGEKDADTTAAIRRYQIRNGLQITGDLNDEMLKSLGVDSSGFRPAVKASPTAAPAASEPEGSDLHAESGESSAPTNPQIAKPLPRPSQNRQFPARPGNELAPGRAAENFAGTPYESSSPEVQRNVIVSAQNILAQRGLYRGAIDGNSGPDLEFSLRAYQSRVGIRVTGKLDLGTLAALQLLPGGKGSSYPSRRRFREKPVRGEYVPER